MRSWGTVKEYHRRLQRPSSRRVKATLEAENPRIQKRLGRVSAVLLFHDANSFSTTLPPFSPLPTIGDESIMVGREVNTNGISTNDWPKNTGSVWFETFERSRGKSW
jgi:hypothetical protein